jgi:hypothetical protein
VEARTKAQEEEGRRFVERVRRAVFVGCGIVVEDDDPVMPVVMAMQVAAGGVARELLARQEVAFRKFVGRRTVAAVAAFAFAFGLAVGALAAKW